MINRIKITLSNPGDNELPVNYHTKFIGAVSSLFTYGKYHGLKNKPYSVSDLQGVYAMNGFLMKSIHSENVFFYITTGDLFFLKEFLSNIIETKDKFNLYGCKIIAIESKEVVLNEKYDIVRTISPVLLKDEEGVFKKRWKYTLRNEIEWITLLNQDAKRKLKAYGCTTDNFKIELVRKIGNDKNVMIHNTFNPTSLAILKITGDYFQRQAIFSYGLGGNTGIGFGALELKKLYEVPID